MEYKYARDLDLEKNSMSYHNNNIFGTVLF